jgi:hypothetical protein
MTIDWTDQLLEQLTWHWDHHLRPHLDGLTDDEYFWEPAEGCWSIRRRGESHAPIAIGTGDFIAEFAMPEPDPAPFTTIAWRIGHVIVGIFGARNANHFGGPPIDYATAEWAGDAKTALAQLDAGYEAWIKGVAGLDADGLAKPVGPSEGPFAEYPYAALVLHINREVIHHLAEVLLLRDLFRASH